MRVGASAVIALCLGGCTIGVGNDGPAVDPQGERQATRAIWGIVPDAPKRKADLRSAMIRGAAVAVAPDTLLADCAAVAGKKRVGLVRHNKYRRATVAHLPHHLEPGGLQQAHQAVAEERAVIGDQDAHGQAFLASGSRTDTQVPWPGQA